MEQNTIYVIKTEDSRGEQVLNSSDFYETLSEAREAFAELQGKPGIRARIVEVPWRPSRA